MHEKILPDIWRIQIPLPGSPLKYLNSYLIKGHKRFLIIDTGMNRKECLDPMIESLERLEVDLKNTDFFITHFHSDHLGLVGEIASDNSRIYFNETEASMIRNFPKSRPEEHMNRRFLFYLHHGFPEDEFRRALTGNPAFKFRYRGRVSFSIVREGDSLEIGRYRFRCLHTPGHSPGHMCLYEPFEKILISGDHILFDITPNITCWPELGNSLKAYLRSLEKIYDLDVRLVLPGHRKVAKDHRGRIRELKEHHQKRLNEIISALEEGEKSAWEVAPRIGWQINQGTWDLFPPAQKWFALGETIAHLEFLEGEGRIKREMDHENKIFFKIHDPGGLMRQVTH